MARTPSTLAAQLAASGLDQDAIVAQLIAAGINDRMAANQAAMAAYTYRKNGANQSPDRARYTVSGYPTDHFLRLPFSFLDHQMADYSGNELLVILYILRRTIGFQKDADNISLTQFTKGIKTRDGRTLDCGTGLSRSTVCRVLNGLEARGILVRERETAADGNHAPTGFQLIWPKLVPE
jgi:hypothetical protein